MKIDWRQAEARDAEILSTDGDSCTVLLGAGGGGISIADKGVRRTIIFHRRCGSHTEEHSTAMMFALLSSRAGEGENLFYALRGILPQFKQGNTALDLDLLDNGTIFANRTPGTR